MSDLLLTEEESRRFSLYCHREADSLKQMAELVGKNLPPAASGAVTKNYRMRAAAYTIVANELDSTEHMSIGPIDVESKP